MDREITAAVSSFLLDEPCLSVRKNVPLSRLTSMGVGGDAVCVLSPRDGGCLIRLLDRLRPSDVPFRVILHSHERQNEKSELTETATVYGYEPVTRTLFLYINGEVRSAPQAVTFAK